MPIEAKVILDSKNPYNGIRLTTLELTYPRFIHAQVLTHRQFSRNSASSRAIPTSKVIERVVEETAIPYFWGKNKRGMSPVKEIENIDEAKSTWIKARDYAISCAEELSDLGLHKQIVNRLIEPFQYITVILSATHFSNWNALRDHGDAQQEITLLARAIKEARDSSSPKEREWHIPFIQPDEEDLDLEIKKKVGTARCARVSYMTHDGVRSIEKDLELHGHLLKGSGFGHWSAFEHVAQATDMKGLYYNFANRRWTYEPIWAGNFQGWIQYRKMHNGECQ